MKKKKQKEPEEYIVNHIVPRKATIEDIPRLIKLSDEIQNRQDDIDFEHSYIGVRDGDIVWAYVFAKNSYIPNEYKNIDWDGIELFPEFIDIWCSDIEHAEKSLAHHLWFYAGNYNQETIFWHRYKELSDKKRLLFKKIRVFFEDDMSDTNQKEHLWWSMFLFAGKCLWNQFGPGGSEDAGLA